MIVRLETETESGACVALAPGEETATKTIGKWGLKEKHGDFMGSIAGLKMRYIIK